jgi:type I site-specific restriction endonuclease
MNTSEHFAETDKQTFKARVGAAAEYSASIQEAMRHNRLRSSDYPLVMSILRAITQGHSEEQWKKENQRALKTLINQPTEQTEPHADATDRYEQTASILKEINLWPW